MELRVPEEALGLLREVFIDAEGACEPWTDAEVVRRTLVRGALEYARSAGRSWEEAQALSRRLRARLA
ncbi:MAG: hypothetical protein KY434_07605 [Actinobacteria bacterium]|nr:hypothetical protein [Actinomycetota bacterium]